MQSCVDKTSNTQGENPQTTPPLFTKRIGGTTYTVSVFHSETSKETAEDKLMRIIENEVRNSA